MEFLRRPFFVVLIGLVVFISIWYHQESTDVPASAGKQPVECVGRVDDIQMGESGIVLVLSEVQAVQLNSQQNISVKKLLVYDCSKQNLFLNSRQGNKLRIRGTFTSFEKAGNPGEFDAFSYYSCKGISGRIFAESASVLDSHCNYFQYILSVFRQRAVEQLFVVMEEEDAGILSAMLFGERAYLPEEDKELYQRTGVGHILVISGLHISLLGAGLFFLLRSYVMSMKRAVFATMVFLFVYGQFTGFQVAAVRAVFMMCCSLFARYTGRNYDPLSALSLIAVITLIKEHYGRSTIDGVFVSHSDADHTNGIVELAQNKDRWGISVNCVFVPNIRKRDENYEELRKVFARNGIPVRKIGRGDVLSRSGLCISCLRPAPDYDWKSENDYSLTLDIAFENIRILCTGDLEQSGEGVLGKLPGPYDVLKVGHHGSKTSTSAEFLSQVSPKNAFISAGRNNRYGHPASEILDRLSAEGARIWSTMDDGAIFVECGGDGKRIDSFWIQKRYIQTIRN